MILFRKARGAHHIAVMNTPSQAMLEAGNYRKPKMKFQGLDLSIENPRGSLRSGVDQGGKEWSTGMLHHYGYIRGTLGVDGDHFDVFVGPNSAAPMVYVITTMAPPEFTQQDEQKAMLGFNTIDEAKDAFFAHYDDPRFLGTITEMPMERFKREVMTTRKAPRMLKAMVLFFKAEGHGKMSATMRKKIGVVGSSHRADMPADAFLLGKERKYPVKVNRDGSWRYSPELLLDAARRARMEGRDDLAAEADRIRARM